MLTLFTKAEPFIPWIAFFLLLFIGGKMIVEVIVDPEPDAGRVTRLTRKTLLIQAIATSIDALSVGFTIAEYGVISALVAAVIIGATTFVICRVGMRDWEADAANNGVALACESVICNEAPDDEANAALEALAKALA